MKKALIDSLGRIAQVEFSTPFTASWPQHWVDCPDDCQAYIWGYAEGVCTPPDPALLLDMAKSAKIAQIERDRDTACIANVTAHARQWQADNVSQRLLGDAITLASAGLPLPAVWRDVTNDNMPLAALSDLLAIAGAIAQQTQTAYATAWARKDAIDAATTVEAVEAA